METFGLILISTCVLIGCLFYCLWYYDNRFALEKVTKQDIFLELVYWLFCSIITLIFMIACGAFLLYVAMFLNQILKNLGVPMLSLFCA